MDNGTEFKNDLFFRVVEQLGVEKKIHLNTEPSPMASLRDFTNSSNVVWQNIFPGIESGMMWCYW